jgi:hypothetical protein
MRTALWIALRVALVIAAAAAIGFFGGFVVANLTTPGGVL